MILVLHLYILTFNNEFDALADTGRDLVAGNAEVGAHLLP